MEGLGEVMAAAAGIGNSSRPKAKAGTDKKGQRLPPWVGSAAEKGVQFAATAVSSCKYFTPR
jgi:hypothetical protein